MSQGTELVRRYFEAWNCGDAAEFRAILAPTWQDHAHPELSSPAAVAESVAAIREQRPGLRFRISTVEEVDDWAEARGQSVIDDLAGTKLRWRFTIEHGRLAELKTLAD